MPKKRAKEYIVPAQILAQLNEQTFGGFLLFTFDESGCPVINSNFDSPLHSSAMLAYVANWSKAIEALNVNIAASTIISSNKKRKK